MVKAKITETNELIKFETDGATIIPIAPFYKNTIQKKLSLGYKGKPFYTILGKVNTLRKPYNYLIFKNFNPRWLTIPPTRKEKAYFDRHKKPRNKKDILEILKLIITDRLFADRELLQEIKNEFKNSEELEKILFVPYIYVKSGIIEKVVPAPKDKTYGVILTRVLRMIFKTFEEELGEDFNFMELDKDKFHEIKLKAKEKIWEDAISKKVGETLFEGIEDIPDEKVKERFMK